MTNRPRLLPHALLLGLILSLPRSTPGATSPDFARQILPILSDKCFACHGPDTKKKDLVRLDSFEAATRDLGGYRAIDPGAPEKSAALLRLHDPEDPMPPKDAEKQLTSAERELLSRWVRGGGTYAQHWAFARPQKHPPQNKEGEGEIDAFVRRHLEERKIDFAPEAGRPTLARRAALLLTGLPPEPEQLAAFLADPDGDAYGKLVDQLLSSPRYGEHQARYWLDAVRYGDTHGLHLDNRRGIHPYRDWLIQAFNNNLPLDKFITWQLAGDLLPNPTLEQRVATGFVRMNPTTSEGGAIPEEFQAKNNFDRTETFGTVFLGASLTCARCHTHKYDPIPQQEYYSLLAFFNNTAESSLDGNSYIYGPTVKAPDNLQGWNRWHELESERDQLLTKAAQDIAARLPAILAHAAARTEWKTENWRISKPAGMDDGPPKESKEWSDAKDLPGLRKDLLPGSGKALWLTFDVTVPADQSLWLTCSSGPGAAIQIDGTPIPSQTADSPGQRLTATQLPLTKGSHQVQLKLAGPERETPVEIRIENPWEQIATTQDWQATAKRAQLLMLADPRGPLGHLLQQPQAHALVERMTRTANDFTTTLVAQDLDKPRETRVLSRGEYDLPIGEPLKPGIITAMSPFPKDAPPNRLGLAQWLTSRDHPLVARVIVNRLWQGVFGEGLVRTPEEFGLQGEQPTHPELLDWLAVELQDNGWDMKKLLRLMVTSRTFRQQSTLRKELDDPENRLLARGPRHRLDAEVLRDLALWASGMMNPHRGGEGVKPYQPGGLWSALAHPASNTKNYVPDKGDSLYRRSLYVYWKRTSPHPMMTLFDAPSRETSCVKRSRTSTPLQSLGLLNETQRLELSRKLAERLLHQRSTDDERLDLLFGLLASRAPTGKERLACSTLLQSMKVRFADNKQDALSLLATGDAPRDETLSPAEVAAWTQVAITVLASDTTILVY